MLRAIRPALIYALAACAFTWPLVLHPFTLFGAHDPTGDPSLNLWTLTWDLQTLSAHPTWFLNGRVFDAPMFFPARHTLAYADHLLLQSIVLWPVYALTRNPVFCYNVLLIASLAASGLAMHLLARTLTGHEGAAFVAGLIFGFAPFHFTHLTHIQLQALYFLPLSFLFLHRVFAAGRRSDVLWLGLVMGLQALSSAYYAVIGGIGIACAALALAAATRRLRDGRLLLRGLAAAAIALAVALPWSLAYLRVERETAAGRTLTEASRGSAVLASYVQAPATNVVYGRTGWLRPSPNARLPRRDGPEQGLFPGFVALLLAVAGAVAAPRHLKRIAVVYAAVAVVGIVLSLGPDGIRPLYAALYRSVFGMSAVRAAARFSVLASVRNRGAGRDRHQFQTAADAGDCAGRDRHRTKQRLNRVSAGAGPDLQRRPLAPRSARDRALWSACRWGSRRATHAACSRRSSTAGRWRTATAACAHRFSQRSSMRCRGCPRPTRC